MTGQTLSVDGGVGRQVPVPDGGSVSVRRRSRSCAATRGRAPTSCPYPRADPADLDRLPGDTVGTARLPVGVRLEFVGDAEALELDYQTHTDDLGYRGAGRGHRRSRS